MGDYRNSLNDHYGQDDLCGLIRRACEKMGFVPEDMTRADLSNLDQVHVRGLEATLEIGLLAGLRPGHRVLDLGSGLGGPARTLAAEFGCEVTGLEIVREFRAAAEMLTEWAGPAERVTFRDGDMREMPFDDGTFDVVVVQHAIMNVEDKEAVFSEVFRLLKPAGGFFLYEICGDDDDALHYPVPWASGPEISFLVSAEELGVQLAEAGFSEKHWDDVTDLVLSWFDGLATGVRSRAVPTRGPNVGVVLGPDAARKSRNLQRNLREGHIRVVQGLFIR